jgi:uncharacterized protein (DUF934 family)
MRRRSHVRPERVIRYRAATPGSVFEARVEADPWRILEAVEDSGALPAGPIVVPFATWRARRDEISLRREPTGVWLAADEDPLALGRDIHSLSLVAVNFPKLSDGRGYSSGVLIRGRLAYRGELRAFGDIGRDHLLMLSRCGFDAFRLPPPRDPEAALAAFAESSVRYQGSIDDPRPLFRRRFHGEAA